MIWTLGSVEDSCSLQQHIQQKVRSGVCFYVLMRRSIDYDDRLWKRWLGLMVIESLWFSFWRNMPATNSFCIVWDKYFGELRSIVMHCIYAIIFQQPTCHRVLSPIWLQGMNGSGFKCKKSTQASQFIVLFAWWMMVLLQYIISQMLLWLSHQS